MLPEKSPALAFEALQELNSTARIKQTFAALTIHAGDFWYIPVSIATTTDSRGVPLNEAFLALVPDERVDLVPLTRLAKSARIFH